MFSLEETDVVVAKLCGGSESIVVYREHVLKFLRLTKDESTGIEDDGVLNWMSSGVIRERVRVMSMGSLPCVGGGGGTLGGGEIAMEDEEVPLVDGVFKGAFGALGDESWCLVEALVDVMEVVEVDDE
ncbi:hypothetical protein Tco_1166326 [Tanacetum coccineum]